jgi:hypothetical protein
MAETKAEHLKNGVEINSTDDVELNAALDTPTTEKPLNLQTLEVSWSNEFTLVRQYIPTITQRYINFSSLINFGLIILVSWEAFALTFQFALLNGGPASMLYGCILVGIGATFVSLSLAELASMYGL